MFTFLDILVVVFLVAAAAGLLAVSLMFLTRNKLIRRICLYVSVALSLFAFYGCVSICWPYFLGQFIFGAVLAAVSIGAVVLERLSKAEGKLFLAARIMAAAALVLGLANTFMI